jgi:hypothetical protein
MGYRQTRSLPWPWDSFSNGAKILPAHRQHYREMGAGAQRYGDPFDARRTGNYYRWLKGPGYLLVRLKHKARSTVRRLKGWALKIRQKLRSQ